jgi:hypothetical protein
METKDDLTGTLARLPDGQLVRIEEVHSDGYVTARRAEGEMQGTVAVCAFNPLGMLTAFFVAGANPLFGFVAGIAGIAVILLLTVGIYFFIVS